MENIKSKNERRINSVEIKDWIILIVPILLNGIIVFLLQKETEKRLERKNKRQDLRDEILILFWKKLQDLNDIFIDSNIQVLKGIAKPEEGINEIQQRIVYLIQFYDTNKFDLETFNLLFESLKNSWENFLKTYNKYVGKTLTIKEKKELGQKLQEVKDQNQELILAVREKY